MEIVRQSPEEFLAARKTANYRPQILGGDMYAAAWDGRPPFSYRDVERMRRDPQVSYGLRILRAPLYQAKVQAQADNPRAAKYITQQFESIWQSSLRQFLKFFEYGISAGEVSFRAERGRVIFDRFDDVHPREARPLEYQHGKLQGQWAGVRVAGGNSSDGTGGSFDLRAPHAFWFSGEAEYGSYWSRPRLAGAYEPWLEKRGRHGAVDSRRLWFKKAAFSGGMIRHPVGYMVIEDGQGGQVRVQNQDYAREVIEKYETGGVLVLPNTRDEKGNFLWEFEAPKSGGAAGDLLQYPKELDREILIGMGIVPEIVDAATVGSGYSGRAIPAQVFFSSCDEVVALLVRTINEQILKPLVWLNFGRVRYQLVPQSLAALVAEDPGKAQQALQPPPEDGDESLGAMQFSWSAARSSSGSIKAVGTDKDAGKTLYGAQAQRALADKDGKSGIDHGNERLPDSDEAIADHARKYGFDPETYAADLHHEYQKARQSGLGTAEDHRKTAYIHAHNQHTNVGPHQEGREEFFGGIGKLKSPDELAKYLSSEDFPLVSSREQVRLAEQLLTASPTALVKAAIKSQTHDAELGEILEHVGERREQKSAPLDHENLDQYLVVADTSTHFSGLFDRVPTLAGSNVRLVKVPDGVKPAQAIKAFGSEAKFVTPLGKGPKVDQAALGDIFESSTAPLKVSAGHAPAKSRTDLGTGTDPFNPSTIPQYRRLTMSHYVRYDPQSGDYSLVPASKVSDLVGVKAEHLADNDDAPDYSEDAKPHTAKDKKGVKKAAKEEAAKAKAEESAARRKEAAAEQIEQALSPLDKQLTEAFIDVPAVHSEGEHWDALNEAKDAAEEAIASGDYRTAAQHYEAMGKAAVAYSSQLGTNEKAADDEGEQQEARDQVRGIAKVARRAQAKIGNVLKSLKLSLARLGWTRGETKERKIKAVGFGEHAGQVLYSDEAERALAQNSAHKEHVAPPRLTDHNPAGGIVAKQYHPFQLEAATVQAAAHAEYASKHQMSVEAYQAAVSKKIQNLVAENEIYHLCESEDLLGILADGRFKSVFETGKTSALPNLQIRKDVEASLLGIPHEAPNTERPIYALFSEPNFEGIHLDQKQNDWLGDVVIWLRPEIKAKAWLTVGDIVGQGLKYTEEDKHVYERADVQATPVNEASVVNVPARRDGLLVCESLSALRAAKIDYLEAKIFGKVQPTAIKEVGFLGEPPPDLLEILKQQQITHRIINRQGATNE